MRKRSLLSLTILAIFALSGLQLWVSHRLSTAGITLTSMTIETQELERENELLRHNIASASSYMTLRQKAEQLGFGEATVRHIVKPPVAMAQ